MSSAVRPHRPRRAAATVLFTVVGLSGCGPQRIASAGGSDTDETSPTEATTGGGSATMGTDTTGDGSCIDRTDCESWEDCIGGSCQDCGTCGCHGFLLEDGLWPRCIDVPWECSTDVDCPPGMICELWSCRYGQRCELQSDCSGSSRCYRDACRHVPCTRAGDCDQGTLCVSGLCTALDVLPSCAGPPTWSAQNLALASTAAPGGLRSFDANLDPAADLLVLGRDGVQVILGGKPPTVGPTVSVGAAPNVLATQLGGDAAGDLVYGDVDLTWRKGLADGTFAAAESLFASGPLHDYVAIDDDQNGFSDVVALAKNGQLLILLSDGMGGMIPGPTGVADALGSLAIGKLHRAFGHNLVVAHESGVTIYEGIEHPLFGIELPGQSRISIAGALLAIDSGDLAPESSLLTVWSFTTNETDLMLAMTTSESSGAVASGDLDGDGSEDIIAAAGDSSIVIVYTEVESGMRCQATATTPLAPLHLATGDFDGAGRVDLAVAGPIGELGLMMQDP